MDGDAIEELLKECGLTLDTTILKCCAQEAARQQREEITSTPVGNSLVQAVQKTSLGTSHRLSSTCPGCGAGHHQGGRQNCPAYHATCHNCNKTGHFAIVCRSRRRQQGAPTQGVTAPTTSAVSLDPILFPQRLSKPQPLRFRCLH